MSARTRSERWLALGLLLAVLCLVYLVGLHWWWTAPHMALNGRVAELREQELRLRMHASQMPQLRERIEGLREKQDAATGFLREGNAELATAGLIQRLEQVMQQVVPDRQRCLLTGRTPAGGTGQDRFPRITIQVRLRCGMEDMARVLHALESGQPELFVDNLLVSARQTGRRRGLGPSEGAELEVAFDLYGFLGGRAASQPPPGNGAMPPPPGGRP